MAARPPMDASTGAPAKDLRLARIIALVAGLCVLALLFAAYSARTRPPQLLPVPQSAAASAVQETGPATVVLAGGCFWGVQAVFQHTRGVLSAVSGYAGGSASDATYAAVSAGSTQHAEAVQVRYDPAAISLGELLQVFFSVAHDPTEVNRQGPDSGPQYRSAVFYDNPAQRQMALDYIAQLNASKLLSAPVATEVTALNGFYRAEPEHQDYVALNPGAPYVAIHDVPKLRNLQTLLPSRFMGQPVLVGQVPN